MEIVYVSKDTVVLIVNVTDNTIILQQKLVDVVVIVNNANKIIKMNAWNAIQDTY